MSKRRPIQERRPSVFGPVVIGLSVTVIVFAVVLVTTGRILRRVLENNEMAQLSSEHTRDKALWEYPLLYRIDRANRLTIVESIGGHQPKPDALVLFEFEREGLGEEFVSCLWVDASISGGQCLCFPYLFVNFYEDNRLLASIGFSHDLKLRSDAWSLTKWIVDGRITEQSAEELADWFSSLGTDFLLRYRERYHQRFANPEQVSPPPLSPESRAILRSLDQRKPNQAVQATTLRAAPDL